MADKKPLVVLELWLDSFLNFERLPEKNIFWLDTMQYLCSLTGNPQNACKSVHIAGSKGKGSVSAMISSILEEAGFPCGLYTSPHILDFSERVGRAREPFSEEIYERTVKKIMPVIDGIIPDRLPGGREITWFELVTLFAFMTFREAGVDWAVYETGLGGRLDATNVIQPEIAVITSIELEHTEFLGDTVEQIAAEKAGIIKPHTPVLIEPQSPSVRAVFKKKAAELQAPLTFVDDVLADSSFSYIPGGMKIALQFNSQFARPVETVLRLCGDFQVWNAAVAALAVKSLLPDITEETIERGLSKTVLPGRFETITQPQHIILDGAHTVHSISSTLRTLQAVTGGADCDVLFACAADKNVYDIARLFFNGGCRFPHITLTRPGALKQADFPALCDAFHQAAGADTVLYEESDHLKAIPHALAKAKEHRRPLLTIGSFYLVAEVKKLLSAYPAGH